MTPDRRLRRILVALSLSAAASLATSLRAQEPVVPGGVPPVTTPREAESVCAGLVVGGAVSKFRASAAASGKTYATQEDALREMAGSPSWALTGVPLVRASCHCVVAAIPGGASDADGRVSVGASMKIILAALGDDKVGKACLDAARQDAGLK